MNKYTIDYSIKENVIRDLEELLRKYLDYYKWDHQIEITKNQDKFLALIEATPPENLIFNLKRLQTILDNFSALQRPIEVGQPKVNKREIDWLEFLQSKLKKLPEQYDDRAIATFYWILSGIAARRLLLYMNPNSRDTLYLNCSKILEQKSINIPS